MSGTAPPVELSVVVPVHRRPERIGEAVASVLDQALPPGTSLEVVVVDDASTDATPAVVAELAAGHREVVAVHRAVNGGPSAARNDGIARARGRWVTFLDSDDLMLPGRLAFQLQRLTGDPPCDAVTGVEVIEVQPGVPAPPWVDRLPPADVFPRHSVMTMMLGRHHLEAVGGFDERIRIGEDVDIAVRLRHHGVRFAHETRPVVVRRIFGDNLIYDDERVRLAVVRALRGQVARRRAAGTA